MVCFVKQAIVQTLKKASDGGGFIVTFADACNSCASICKTKPERKLFVQSKEAKGRQKRGEGVFCR